MGAADEPGDYYVGLISGTSMDGIDAALVTFGERACSVVATRSHDYPGDLRDRLKRAIVSPDETGFDELGLLDHDVGASFRDAALALLAQAGIGAPRVAAIGCHGQTVRHLPHAPRPFTLQIGDPNLVASGTGITTVADFRRADLAVGGEGAPLTPAFHQWLFGSTAADRVVLNIGGIANVTVLPKDKSPVIGFDTGPGNTLMDAWMRHTSGDAFDQGGEVAARGTVYGDLLQRLMQDPYFSQPPPKSTGFEYFNMEWLQRQGFALGDLAATDVQATLSELSARTIAGAIRQHGRGAREIFVCGGGVHNTHLMQRLASVLPAADLRPTGDLGLHPDWVEAAAFAWLAKRRLDGLPGNLPSVTGARRAAILGGIYMSTS